MRRVVREKGQKEGGRVGRKGEKEGLRNRGRDEGWEGRINKQIKSEGNG